MIVNPGLRRQPAGLLQQTFNRAAFAWSGSTSIVPERGAYTPTFARAVTAYVRDHEGILRLAKSGEARFRNRRRVENLLTATATLATQDVTTIAGTYTLSFYGTGSVALSGTVTDNLAGTGASTRVQKTVTATAGTLTLTVTGSVTSAQLENVTGQTTQTAAEYVSVGVLSAPYHGANVDGVKYFNITLAGVAISDTGISSGYLSEREAIDTCLYSRTFENAAWVKTNITADDNSVAGPDGVALSASTLTATAGNGTIIQDLGVVASAAKCGAIYIKRKTGTGAIEMTLDGGATWTAVTVTSGWTKVYITQTLADEDFGLRIVTNGDAIYVDFAQVELGKKPTSPIPTVAAAVTRVADSLTYDVTGLWSNTQGTLYAESSVEYADDFGVNRTSALFGRSTPTALEIFVLHARSADGRRNTGMNNTTSQASYGPTVTTETLAKLAIAYQENNTDQAISGTTTVTDTVCTVPADLTTLYIGRGDGTLAELDGCVRNVYYWRRKLSKDAIARITTL